MGEGQASDSAVHSITSTTTSILFTWPPENTSVCCQALQRSSFWIKLAFRTFAWPGLGLEDHQEIVLGQLVLPEPKEAKPDGEKTFRGWCFGATIPLNSIQSFLYLEIPVKSDWNGDLFSFSRSCSTSWATCINNAGPGASTTTAGGPAAGSRARVTCSPGCTRISTFTTSTSTRGRAPSKNSAGATVSPRVPLSLSRDCQEPTH